MMLTKEDIDFLLNVVKHTNYLGEEEGDQFKRVEDGLEELKKLWSKEGLSIAEVDIYLLGEVPGRRQLTQVHSFAVGDTYKLLPEDDDPEDAIDDWKIQDVRAHAERE